MEIPRVFFSATRLLGAVTLDGVLPCWQCLFEDNQKRLQERPRKPAANVPTRLEAGSCGITCGQVQFNPL